MSLKHTASDISSIKKEEDVLLGGADILQVQMNLEIDSVRSMENWGHLQFGIVHGSLGRNRYPLLFSLYV